MNRLFDPGPTPDPPPKLSADAARTQRRRNLFARGVHPATKVALREQANIKDPVTCGDCAHFLRTRHNTKWYFKCDLIPRTGGPGTDIRKSWVACVKYETL